MMCFFAAITKKNKHMVVVFTEKLFFKIGDNLISDDAEWCVSASAYRFLHTLFDEYKRAVMSFDKQVMDFYKSNPPREFEDDFDKNGYSAFVTRWYSLYDKAITT